MPTSLDRARRARDQEAARMKSDAAALAAETARPHVAAADVAALLNRVGECVRALPSFGRARTRTSAVIAKQTLSAISTCNPSRLPDGDPLGPVLARVDATREALRETVTTGVERIAIARWLGQLHIPGQPAAGQPAERGLPAHAYLLCGGQVIRQPGRHAHERAGEDGPALIEERIDDLARAGALIAAEIDRLQQLGERRYA
jgi:hypothetical protein